MFHTDHPETKISAKEMHPIIQLLERYLFKNYTKDYIIKLFYDRDYPNDLPYTTLFS